MREIKFRGKSTMSGKWFYGSLIKDKSRRWISTQEEHWNLGVFDNFDVVPETVGQYTGLKDMNGKEIFEGDIVKCFKSHNSLVCFAMYSFGLKTKVRGFEPFYDIYGQCEVIGNIYENPELLEKQK